MRCIPLLLAALSIHLLLPPSSFAEENATQLELREVRQAVQQQTRQIELLSEQIGRLTRALESQRAPELAVQAPRAEVLKPAPEAAPDAPSAEPVPKAEAVPVGPKHTVAKGETLTSIAKLYNIPIADLKNANKIENERKLQIGQILTVPATKTPETADKKENP